MEEFGKLRHRRQGQRLTEWEMKGIKASVKYREKEVAIENIDTERGDVSSSA